MKKIIITLMTCLMLVVLVNPVLAQEDKTSTTEYVYGQEVTGNVKVGETSETVTSFSLDSEQMLELDLSSEKASVRVLIYDSGHNLVDDISTEYDEETETGEATLVFTLPAGDYSIEVVGITGEGTYTYVLTLQGEDVNGIYEGAEFYVVPKEETLGNVPTAIISDDDALENAKKDSIRGNKNKSSNTYAVESRIPSTFDMYPGQIYNVVTEWGYADPPSYTDFSSDTTAVATVSLSGEIRAVAVGYVRISYKYNGTSCTIDILVTRSLLHTDQFSYFNHKMKAVVGEKFNVTLQGAGSGTTTYSSTNTSIATVSETGEVTAKKTGKVYIAAARGAYSDVLEVDVVKPSFFANDKFSGLYVSSQIDMKKALWAGEGKVTWKSSKTSVAKIDSQGMLTALSAGTTTISAKIGSYTVKVAVKVLANSKTYPPRYTNNSHYMNGYINFDLLKVYYSGTTFKAQVKIVNRTTKTIVKFDPITIIIYEPLTLSIIANQSFANYKMDLAINKFKTVTFSFSTGTLIRGVVLKNFDWKLQVE